MFSTVNNEQYTTTVDLPDEGWTTVKGSTDDLSKIYEEIYQEGPLKFEIEMFNDNGTCEIWYIR